MCGLCEAYLEPEDIPMVKTDPNYQVAHTPGPWAARKSDNDIGGPTYFDIVSPHALGPHNGEVDIVRVTGNKPANAHLIAAAPDLLEACASVWAALADNPDPLMQVLAAECRAAIAKATEKHQH